jgi:hypothetical protein
MTAPSSPSAFTNAICSWDGGALGKKGIAIHKRIKRMRHAHTRFFMRLIVCACTCSIVQFRNAVTLKKAVKTDF